MGDSVGETSDDPPFCERIFSEFKYSDICEYHPHLGSLSVL